MIDQSVLKRDLQNCIADWPAQLRHYYSSTNPAAFQQATVNVNTLDDISQLLEGGLLDNMTMTILAVAADFTFTPRNRDRCDVQMSDGTWLRLEVKRMPDYYAPLGPELIFTLGTPEA